MPAIGGEHRGDDEDEQLHVVRADADDPHAQLVLAHRLGDVAGAAALDPEHDEVDDHEDAERQPVEVAGVDARRRARRARA